jgi:hypothetical protein
MIPVNNKSMIAFLFSQMEKLDKNEIDVEHAKQQASLAKQVNTAMKYELDRVRVKMELKSHNYEFKDNIELREIESKNFE